MYGGLQTAIGALALAGVAARAAARVRRCCRWASWPPASRWRASAASRSTAGLSSYTALGLGFEITTAGLSAWFLSREPRAGRPRSA